jgi:hypothetical protein
MRGRKSVKITLDISLFIRLEFLPRCTHTSLPGGNHDHCTVDAA